MSVIVNDRHFMVNKKLGFGAFSNVYEIVDKNNKKYALKITDLTKRKRKRSLGEVELHKNLAHKNILKLIDDMEGTLDHYIIAEFCDGGSLSDKSSGLLLRNFNIIVGGIISGLKYMHSNRIIHRDIKPDNILISGSKIKIADFGLSYRLEENETLVYRPAGTPNYISPEILAETGYLFETDIWSLGVLMYKILYKQVPFIDKTDKSLQRLYKLILNGIPLYKSYHNKERNDVFGEFIRGKEQLIRRILDKDPKTRITLDEIEASL